MSGVLGQHRGKVVYIPIVVPDNIFVGIAHGMGILAGILLIVCCASSRWEQIDVVVPPDSVYDPTLTATIVFGLRSMHITYCEAYNATAVGTTAYDGCGFEDVFYSSCGDTNDWCESHGDTTTTFGLLIINAIAVFATCGAALMRLGLLPTGFMISGWITLLSIMSFRQESAMFVPSSYLQSWIDYGTSSGSYLWAYFGTLLSCMMLSIAVAFATYGYIRASRADAERVAEEERNQRQARDVSNSESNLDTNSAAPPPLPDNFKM